MSLKALDELRGWIVATVDYGLGPNGTNLEQLHDIADAIEAEIAERFMELPVDADGVPIHIGDTLLKSTGAPKASYGDVVGVSDDSVWFNAKNGWESNWSSMTRHYVPDSIGRIVQDMRDSISPGAGLAYDEVLDFVERLEKRLERLGGGE